MSAAPTLEHPAEPREPQSPSKASLRDKVDPRLPLVVLLAALVYALLGTLQKTPLITPDEFTYVFKTRSILDGNLPTGGSIHTLYPYLIAPLWTGSATTGFALTKVLNALLFSTQAIPVWLLASRVMSRRAALITTLATLAGTWMCLTGSVVTESVAYPLTTASLCALVAVLIRPTTKLWILAFAFAIAAAAFRSQLLVLIPILFLAAVADVVRAPRAARRDVFRQHRLPIVVLGLGFVALLVVVIAAPGAFGGYQDTLKQLSVSGKVFTKSGLQLAELAAGAGLLPLLLTLGLAASGKNWRDPIVGPFLVVAVVATLGFAVESGMFLAVRHEVTWGIQRYMLYAAPVLLMITALCFVRPALLSTRTLVVALAGACLLALSPRVEVGGEQFGRLGIAESVGKLGLSDGLSLALTALVMVGAIILLRRRGSHRLAIAGVVLIGALFLVQDVVAWSALDVTHRWRSTLPTDASWIDNHAHGKVAVFAVQPSETLPYLEVFNKSIRSTYLPPGVSLHGATKTPLCSWSATAAGAVRFGPGCGAAPRELLLTDPALRLSFTDEQSSTSDAHAGRLVELRGSPQLLAALIPPCPRVPYLAVDPRDLSTRWIMKCQATFAGRMWLTKAGTLRLTFRGGARPQHVQVGKESRLIPPRVVTTLALAAPAGASEFNLPLDWKGQGGQWPTFLRADVSVPGQPARQIS